MKNDMDKTLIVIPTYNEIENIEEIVTAVLSQSELVHLLIIDDNSPDGTGNRVKSLFSKYNSSVSRLHIIERKKKLGLGTAYLTGFSFGLEHGYEFIIEMDADFSHNPDDIIKLYQECSKEDVDMVVGSRYCKGVNVVNWPIGRVLLSYFASVYVRFITGLNIMDTTAGFVCYRRRALELLLSDKNRIEFIGYAFQIEMKFNATKCGLRIVEIPIIFTDRTKGKSKMSGSIFKEAIYAVIKLKVLSWFRKYPKLPAQPLS